MLMCFIPMSRTCLPKGVLSIVTEGNIDYAAMKQCFDVMDKVDDNIFPEDVDRVHMKLKMMQLVSKMKECNLIIFAKCFSFFFFGVNC